MEINGINLTEEIMSNLRYLQESTENMNACLDAFDKTISFVAKKTDSGDQEAAAGLRMISGLCFVKDIFISFSGLKK